MSKKRIVIIGAGTMLSIFIDIIEKQDLFIIVGLIDSKAEINSEIYGIKVLGKQEDIDILQKQYNIQGGCVTIGDNYSRYLILQEINQKINQNNWEWVNVIHPSCIIGNNVKFGKGIIAMARCTFNPNVKLGDFTAFYTGCIIEHDCIIEQFASVSAGSILGGKVKMEEFSAVTLGCVIFDRITIGYGSVIGSGSLVTKDIPSNVLAYGSPCLPINKRILTDKYLK